MPVILIYIGKNFNIATFLVIVSSILGDTVRTYYNLLLYMALKRSQTKFIFSSCTLFHPVPSVLCISMQIIVLVLKQDTSKPSLALLLILQILKKTGLES
jgi:hypothetical protein